jgi:hypothetical protein
LLLLLSALQEEVAELKVVPLKLVPTVSISSRCSRERETVGIWTLLDFLPSVMDILLRGEILTKEELASPMLKPPIC